MGTSGTAVEMTAKIFQSIITRLQFFWHLGVLGEVKKGKKKKKKLTVWEDYRRKNVSEE